MYFFLFKKDAKKKKCRVALPSCLVEKVRLKYPEASVDNYVGFVSSVRCKASTTSITRSRIIAGSEPPTFPSQLVQLAIPDTWAEEQSTPPSKRPSFPGLPPLQSPVPSSSSSLQPPHFVPQTPQNRARKPAKPVIQTGVNNDNRREGITGESGEGSHG